MHTGSQNLWFYEKLQKARTPEPHNRMVFGGERMQVPCTIGARLVSIASEDFSHAAGRSAVLPPTGIWTPRKKHLRYGLLSIRSAFRGRLSYPGRFVLQKA